MIHASPNSFATADGQAGSGRTAPFQARVLANFVLTGPDSSNEKRHVEVDLGGSGLRYEAGDALAIMPHNDPLLVETVLARFGIAGSAPVLVDGEQTAFGKALASRFEIGVASPRFLRHWAMLSGSTELRFLATPENTAARRRYLHENHIEDIMRSHPVPGLNAEAVLPGLRLLQPRLFSIASSPTANPHRVAIVTATLAYRLHGELRRGVVSGYQIPHAGSGARLPVFIEPASDFRLPADDAAIIMVGAGTGVAPFRAFVAERRARRARGRSWLFFGERTSRSDSLYGAEWQQALEDGYLADLDLAFSRDLSQKVYVQHQLLHRGAEVFAWLQDGASLYVCGDAASMAPAVHAALIDLIETHSNMDRDGAVEYVRHLARAHRYRRSIY